MLSYNLYTRRVKRFGFVNYVYLIIDKMTNETAIVDPSWDYEGLMELVKQLNVKIDIILLTHSHMDHVYLVERIVEKYKDVKVYISDLECQYYDYYAPNMIRLYDGDIIKIGETYVNCILTPGHTKGSMCFLLDDCIFTGDTLFIEGCGMCSSLGGDARDMYESVQRLKKIIPEYTKVYAAHSYGKEPGCIMKDVMNENIYLNIDDVNKFIEFRNRKRQPKLFDFK